MELRSVKEIETHFNKNMIGMKFKISGMYGDDIITLVGKEKGFGATFSSKVTGKVHYMSGALSVKHLNS